MLKENFLKKYIYQYKFQLIFLIILDLILCGLSIFNTYFVGKYLDLLVSKLNHNIVYKFAIILLVLSLLTILFRYIKNYISTKTQTNLCFDINFLVLKYIKKIPESFFREIDSVYLNQRINSDSNSVINFFMSVIVRSITLIVSFLVILFMIKDANIIIMYVALLSIPPYIILYFFFQKKLYNVTLYLKEEQNKFFSMIHKHMKNINFVKLNCLFEKLDNATISAYPKLLKSVLKYFKYSYTFESLNSIIYDIFNIFLFFYGGLQILNNKMTIGEFVAIKGYYGMLMGIILEFVSILKSYPDALVSYDRLLEILKTPQEINGDKKIDEIEYIQLSNLNMLINNEYIFNNVSYNFNKGKIYLIRGCNGSGKSTLIKSILGLYINEFNGDIKYNTDSIKDIDMYDLRKHKISIVDQEAELIFSNLNENLTQNISGIDLGELDELIKLFSLDIDMNEIRNKKSNHRQFSGGEKQKISIIRTLLKDPDVIVMDEPTASLDVNSVEILIDKIMKIKNNKIIIIISHDYRIDNIADEIIDLSDSSAKSTPVIFDDAILSSYPT